MADPITRTPENVCSRCGEVTDATAMVDRAEKPLEGDVSICMYCGHATIFQADLTLREPTEEEQAQLLADPNIQEHQRAVWHLPPRQARHSAPGGAQGKAKP